MPDDISMAKLAATIELMNAAIRESLGRYRDAAARRRTLWFRRNRLNSSTIYVQAG